MKNDLSSEFLHLFSNKSGLFATGALFWVTFEEYGHDSVSKPVATGVLCPGQEIGHQFAEFEALLVVRGCPFVE